MAEPSAAHSRAATILGLVLGVSLALILVLAGPLLLFNPWFVSLEQARNGVPARVGATQPQVEVVTGGILCDLVLRCDDFDETLHGAVLLTADERAHMRDVGNLVRALLITLAVSFVALVATMVALRREPWRIGRILLRTGTLVGVVALLAGFAFATAFDEAFLVFHEIFFPQGNFLFGPDSNLLRLFPEGFWFEAALAAGATILVGSVVAVLIGWRLTRRTAQPAFI